MMKMQLGMMGGGGGPGQTPDYRKMLKAEISAADANEFSSALATVEQDLVKRWRR